MADYRPIRTMTWLHPACVDKFRKLQMMLINAHASGETNDRFTVFETYRTPSRQEYLYAQGTTRAHAWESAHNWGMAVDFVPFKDKSWSWRDEHDWDFLKKKAIEAGLVVPIKWDRVHVQAPEWAIGRTVIAGLSYFDPDDETYSDIA